MTLNYIETVIQDIMNDEAFSLTDPKVHVILKGIDNTVIPVNAKVDGQSVVNIEVLNMVDQFRLDVLAAQKVADNYRDRDLAEFSGDVLDDMLQVAISCFATGLWKFVNIKLAVPVTPTVTYPTEWKATKNIDSYQVWRQIRALRPGEPMNSGVQEYHPDAYFETREEAVAFAQMLNSR